jgi:hypothetical protein
MLFFTAQPLLVYCQRPGKEPVQRSSCCSPKTCHKKEKLPKPANGDCDRTNSCNPFASCSQCQYVAAYRFTYTISIDQITDSKKVIRKENIASGFLAECWQPPEFALL